MELISAVNEFIHAHTFVAPKIIATLGWLAFVYLITVAQVALHEVAHAAAYILFCRRPQVMGTGVAVISIRGIFIVFPFPSGFAGRLDAPINAGLNRVQRVLVCLCGLTATTAATVAGVLLARKMPTDSAAKFALTAFSSMGAFILPGNLILPNSDGIKIWQALTDRQKNGVPRRTVLHRVLYGLLVALLFILSIIVGAILAAAVVAESYG